MAPFYSELDTPVDVTFIQHPFCSEYPAMDGPVRTGARASLPPRFEDAPLSLVPTHTPVLDPAIPAVRPVRATRGWRRRRGDAQILADAAALEVLAVATYQAALAVPGVVAAGGDLVAFLRATLLEHQDHLAAITSTLTEITSVPPRGIDLGPLASLDHARAGLASASAAAALVYQTEWRVAESYGADIAHVIDPEVARVLATILGAESRHVAVLAATQALLSPADPSTTSHM